jgi:hypothetical protein
MKTLSCSILSAVIGALSLTTLGQPAQAQQPQSMFIEGDMVRGNTQKGQTGPLCVLNSQFKRNENAVFRVRVRDVTGKPLDDKELKSVVVELSDGQKLPMRYGARLGDPGRLSDRHAVLQNRCHRSAGPHPDLADVPGATLAGHRGRRDGGIFRHPASAAVAAAFRERLRAPAEWRFAGHAGNSGNRKSRHDGAVS